MRLDMLSTKYRPFCLGRCDIHYIPWNMHTAWSHFVLLWWYFYQFSVYFLMARLKMRLNSLANGVQTNFSVWLMVGVSQTVSTYYYATIWRHQATMCWLINIDINVCLDTEINSLFGQFLSRFLINQIRFWHSYHYGIWCWSLLAVEWTPIFTS